MILTLLLGLGGVLGWGLLGACAQAPDTSFPGPLTTGWPEARDIAAEDTTRAPDRRNWCPYQQSRLVTFVAACRTEKFLIHAQQPCPQGAPDCQRVKVMYRLAYKPKYQVKQKVVGSVVWRCCPGYMGPDCLDHDPTALPDSADPQDSLQDAWERPVSYKPVHQPAGISQAAAQQERPMAELQNDLHHVAESLLDRQADLPSNPTVATTEEANQMELGLAGSALQQMLLPHVEAFLRRHFSPIWRGFNESLHHLSESIRNLSLDVEANRQAIQRVQESMVISSDFQELGAKFQSKEEENAQSVAQLRHKVEHHLQAQNLSLQRSLQEAQAHMDAKLKRLSRALQLPAVNGSLLVMAEAGTGARPEPESLQARLGQQQKNLSSLLVATGRQEEELQRDLAAMQTTLGQHTKAIDELYSESEETFHQISTVERQVMELQVNHTELRELRVILMEKSLIMEENKEEMERRLLELNLTLQHLQGSHADLLQEVKNCNCQKLSLKLATLWRTAPALEEIPASLHVQSQPDAPALSALQAALEELSLALDTQRADANRASLDRARLRSHLQGLVSEVAALQKAQGLMGLEIRQLHSSFASLLKDALRHEAVLAALFGEEVLETFGEKEPNPLPLRYEQIRLGLLEAASALREQTLAWVALATRVSHLEQGPGPVGLARLKADVQRLGIQVEQATRCCEAHSHLLQQGLPGAIISTQSDLERHQKLFHSLFKNFQGLLATNSTIDLGKLQVRLTKNRKKQHRVTLRSRPRKEAEPWVEPPGLGQALAAELMEAGSRVAFYAGCSEGTTALQTMKFNTTYVNIGSNYFPEHGYFQAPERGVYLFAVSIDFGPGSGSGQLVIGGHHQTPVHTVGSTAATFTVFELQKGERVWFEVTQGLVTKRNPPSSTFGGFLIFKT